MSRSQHPNAPLTPEGRRRMVACVLDEGWSIEATADRFQIDPKTVRKWRDRFSVRRLEGLVDEPRPGTPRTVTDEQVESAPQAFRTLDGLLARLRVGDETRRDRRLDDRHSAGIRQV